MASGLNCSRESGMKTHPEPVTFDRLKGESLIRGESSLALVCNESFDDIAAWLEACAG